MELKRHEMNINPGSKGYISGPIKFRFTPVRERSAMIDCYYESDYDNNGSDADTVDHFQSSPNSPASNTSLSCDGEEDERGWIDCDSEDTERMSLITSKWTMAHHELLNNKQLWWNIEIIVKKEPFLDDYSQIQYIIVVEKEAIFCRLIEDRFTSSVQAVLVCGFGFPDASTRSAVAILKARFCDAVVIGLCDYNIDGFLLLMSYKFECPSFRYEGKGLAVNSLMWGGLRHSHISTFCFKSEPLTEREKRRIERTIKEIKDAFTSEDNQMITKKRCADGNGKPLTRKKWEIGTKAYIAELENMLKSNISIQLEGLLEVSLDYVSTFLHKLLRDYDYI